LTKVRPKSRATWRTWLQKHHASSSGVWLVFAKKHSGIATLSYDDAVEEALCFGWIDSLMKPVDDRFYMQLFTPRKPKSLWSHSNKARVKHLRAKGLMKPAGEAAIARAKKCGAWTALSAPESRRMTADLRKALDADPIAQENWPAFTDSQRKQFLYWLHSAKRPETRASRIATIVDLVLRKITPSQAYERVRLNRRASRARAPSRARRRRG
jgi:uncharacterized protein YdeI (YjbR/CyaY-like superfamily)